MFCFVYLLRVRYLFFVILTIYQVLASILVMGAATSGLKVDTIIGPKGLAEEVVSLDREDNGNYISTSKKK